jgi:hypothetical protein
MIFLLDSSNLFVLQSRTEAVCGLFSTFLWLFHYPNVGNASLPVTFRLSGTNAVGHQSGPNSQLSIRRTTLLYRCKEAECVGTEEIRTLYWCFCFHCPRSLSWPRSIASNISMLRDMCYAGQKSGLFLDSSTD